MFALQKQPLSRSLSGAILRHVTIWPIDVVRFWCLDMSMAASQKRFLILATNVFSVVRHAPCGVSVHGDVRDFEN